VGAIVILAAVFVIGLQVGRVIEKSAVSPETRSVKSAVPAVTKNAPVKGDATDIRKDLGSYSEEAVKVPVVPPPDARTTVNEVEKGLTFQETLQRKDASPGPLLRPSRTDNTAVSKGRDGRDTGGQKYAVQAGSFRDKGAAEACRKRLENAGLTVRVVKADAKNGDKYYRVMVGPFTEKGAARKAVQKLKNEMKIDAFLRPG
jgi:cell division septation protein DedD